MNHWYNAAAKTYIISFARLFSNIHVKRIDSLGAEVKDIKVPLVYASKSKLSYLLQNTEDAVSLVLPIMGFGIEAIEYDSERKNNSLNEIRIDDSTYIFEGVPYNFNFTVTVKTKYQDDMWQIIEQFLYYFKPGTSMNVKELPFSTADRDVNVVMLAHNLNFENDYGQEESRELEASFNFVLKGMIYPPALTDGAIIEHVDSNFINKLDYQIAQISHDFIDPDTVTTINES
jgi:hypothetical protein